MIEYGNGLLFIGKDSLEIDTGLSEREATHGKVFQNINENGIIIKLKDDGTFDFENYAFSGNYLKIAKGRKTESVFVKGSGFSGRPLYELFSTDKEKAIQGVNLLALAVEQAKQKEIFLPNNGPLGTIIGEGENENQILLLPFTIFEKSLYSRNDTEYSRFAGIFKKPSLSDIDSWRFTLSVYGYRLLSDCNPFDNLDSSERILDYLDFNFVPLENLVALKDVTGKEIDTKHLFSVITNNLRVISPEALKKNKRNKYAKLKSIPLSTIPSGFSVEILKFEENSDYQKLKKKIDTTRFFRKNSFKFKVAGGVLAACLFILVSTIIDKKDAPSTLGLTPEEAIEMMYSGFNHLDIDIYGATLEKKSIGKDYENFITNMYVTGRVRETYESEKATYTLAQWVNLRNPVSSYFFGVTDVKITLLEAGETERRYRVDYYIMYNEPETNVYGFKESDVLGMVFKKDRWLVSSIETTQSDVTVDGLEFYNDVKTVCDSIPESEKQSQGAIVCRELKPKYSWLPTPEEADIGYAEIIDKYTSIFAEKE